MLGPMLVLALTAVSLSAACMPDPSLPANLTSTAQPLCAGFIDVTLPPYNAKGDGATDDSLAIQNAVNDAYTYRLTTVFPGNRTYLVTKQIRCVQDGKPESVRLFGFGLIGLAEQTSTRPVIKLADASNVSDNIFIYFQLIVDGKADPASHYSAMLRNVIVDVGDNPSVSGISMSGAQLCSIEDVLVKGSAFLAGVVGLPGSGGYTSNLEVQGGQIGVWQNQFRPNPSITGLKLSGQHCCSGCCAAGTPSLPSAILLQNCRGPLVVSGFIIEQLSGTMQHVTEEEQHGYAAIRIRGNLEYESSPGGDISIAFEDGSIMMANSAGAAISNEMGSDSTLRNVWVMASALVNASSMQGSLVVPAAPGSWRKVEHWIYTSSGNIVVQNGTDISSSRRPFSQPFPLGLPLLPPAPAPAPAALLLMHSWDPAALPQWAPANTSALTILDAARDYGATPSWADPDDDDSSALQRAIDAAAALQRQVQRQEGGNEGGEAGGKKVVVFVPRGDYHVRTPLRVHPGTALIGAGKHMAALVHPMQPSADKPVPMLRLEADTASDTAETAATTHLSDLLLVQEMSKKNEEGVKGWYIQVEAQSNLLRDVGTEISIRSGSSDYNRAGATSSSTSSTPCVEFRGQAAGKFYGLCLDHSTVCDVLLTVNGTGRGSSSLHFYQTSIEHLPVLYQVQVWRSSHVSFHALKYEPAGVFPKERMGAGVLGFHSCADVSVFGGSGNYGIMNSSLGDDIFYAYNTKNLSLVALVRKNITGEYKGGKWLKVVESVTSAAKTEIPGTKPLLSFVSNGTSFGS